MDVIVLVDFLFNDKFLHDSFSGPMSHFNTNSQF
jgi:hypothetical protein